MSEIPREIESDLAALADGMLAPERRAELLAHVQRSPQLAGELEAQRRALALMGEAQVGAPQSLRGHLQSLVDTHIAGAEAQPSLRRLAPRPLLAGMLAAAGACAVALALVLGGRSTTTPSLRDAFALTLGPAKAQAPRESHTHPAQLNVAVEGVSFPYWSERFGWRATGTRADQLGGRPVRTVFYADAQGRRIGYAIVAGPAPNVAGGTVRWRRGVRYRVLGDRGVPVVIWTRSGRACVISGRGVSAATLVALASWSDLEARSKGAST
jgi:hypothetical protein